MVLRDEDDNNEQQQQPHHSDGRHVAEYFCILGVGDKLVWKHTQKQQQQEQQQSTPTDSYLPEDEEEETLMEERFWREIVQVAIVRCDPRPNHIPSVASNVTESSGLEVSVSSSTHPDTIPIISAEVSEQYKDWELLRHTLPASRPGYLRLHVDAEQNSRRQNDGKLNTASPLVWTKSQIFDANLEWSEGLHNKLIEECHKHLKSNSQSHHMKMNKLVRKVEVTLRNLRSRSKDAPDEQQSPPQYYLAYKRRSDRDQPAVADVQLLYMRLHTSCIAALPAPEDSGIQSTNAAKKNPLSLASKTILPNIAGQLLERYQSQAKLPMSPDDGIAEGQDAVVRLVPVQAYLQLPDGYDEWVIPQEFLYVRDPSSLVVEPAVSKEDQRHRKTILFEHDNTSELSSGSGVGVEINILSSRSESFDPDMLAPRIVLMMVGDVAGESYDNDQFVMVPVLAVRRQSFADEERFHEADAALVDLTISFADQDGNVIMPGERIHTSRLQEDDEEDEDDGIFNILGKTKWASAYRQSLWKDSRPTQFGVPVILGRRNLSFGFADVAFATKVHGRFPYKNYKDFPLPEEELPMFCYPTGCRLHRARFSDAPLPEYYGFVVKNERGDSIYISCVSFMEPLTIHKVNQLNDMSEKRRRTSLAHKSFCELRERKKFKITDFDGSASDVSTDVDSSVLLTGFDDMTTFEKKTICIVSRFPFWTAFRKFLSHLHILSGSTSNLPLERYISHLLLSVPVPKPGGASVVVPLPALNDPLVLYMPPEKDFPLVDLPFQRLAACLDMKTTVTVVLGLLALERKVIVMSTRPSLVLDVCELLRSLLFPFELCAPYVPRLTEPFKSSLEFPGALFVGIHRDGTEDGLAEAVRRVPPEDSVLVDLDSGVLTSEGGRNEVLSAIWDMIPVGARSFLVTELETICQDAGIVDGQEPLDSQFDSAFDVALPAAVEDMELVSANGCEPLDDRAIRDAFLRFFCYILGGYERFLVVPDADYLISGNEWFNAQGFLSSVQPEKRAYLEALVSTQLFQSFIQRRTEASDVHCMLFDESLAEFHSSSIPYGRLGGDVESVMSGDNSRVMFSLLVDQSALLPPTGDPLMLALNQSIDASEAESSINMSRTSGAECPYSVKYGDWAVNSNGDFVTAPSRQGLPVGARFSYCVDGNPCFPHYFNARFFLPLEPESLLIEATKIPNPLLARTERELEEATRRRRMATSYRGLQNQRRCMWQLPKLMGSHFLGAWLMCIPVQVSQKGLSHEQQSRFLMRALGALRLLRSKQRIVPDEAAYRALMVACGRTDSDRRLELVKLFGLLRSDGLFPSAVTLGQYTRALAEGYSKRQDVIPQDDDFDSIEVTESSSRIGARADSSTVKSSKEKEASLAALDTNLATLESHGRRWRQRLNSQLNNENDELERKNRMTNKSWSPIVFSTSFVPSTSDNKEGTDEVKLIAMWSRTRGCSNCMYIPLEEEIMAGWDVVGGENEIPGAVACPRCGALIIPMLGYRELTIEEALAIGSSVDTNLDCSVADFGALPPQVRPTVDEEGDDVSYVAYVSPASLRLALEHYVEEYGEEVLVRDRLKTLDSEIFYNFWWQCARFSLPLPLPITSIDDTFPCHCIAFAAWDHSVAERGCQSAAKVILPLLDESRDLPFDEDIPADAFEDVPLLSRFNLQGFFSTVWDHVDLSKILVKLVEACDKRDFKPVVEAVLTCNKRRLALYTPATNDTFSEAHSAANVPVPSDAGELSPSLELDIYRTIMYLSTYQCTTAFHSFFPAAMKPCKGYHFWCAIGTPLPIFDRLIRDGVKRANSTKEHHVIAPVRDISDVALGFRCVFGHLI